MQRFHNCTYPDKYFLIEEAIVGNTPPYKRAPLRNLTLNRVFEQICQLRNFETDAGNLYRLMQQMTSNFILFNFANAVK